MSNDAQNLSKARAIIASLVETLEEDGQGILDVVTDARWFMEETNEQSSFRPVSRSTLIGQLRGALYLAENPNYDTFEFDLGNTDFSFEFEENSLRE